MGLQRVRSDLVTKHNNSEVIPESRVFCGVGRGRWPQVPAGTDSTPALLPFHMHVKFCIIMRLGGGPCASQRPAGGMVPELRGWFCDTC